MPAAIPNPSVFTLFFSRFPVNNEILASSLQVRRLMTEPTDFDPAKRYVRIVSTRADGMVEFEFAVGEPQLFVEMLLPQAEFEQFCRDQKVRPSHGALPEAASGSAEHEWDWSLRSARERHFRDEN